MRVGFLARLAAIAAGFLLGTAMCAAALSSDTPSLPDLKTTEALGAELFAQSGATGMVMLLVRGDEVFFQGYGETAPGSQRRPDRYSVVRLCSLTKVFTSMLSRTFFAYIVINQIVPSASRLK